jgi:MFS transporter, DHA1 family, multidrug resistance protein
MLSTVHCSVESNLFSMTPSPSTASSSSAHHRGAGQPPRSTWALVTTLALLAALSPLATDMYLSAFHAMANDLDTSTQRMGGTLSAYFLGMAVGQAIYGPLIDRFGRRTPLLIGTTVYLLCTIGCLITPDISVFTALRLLQAVGGCAGLVAGRAVINDLFDRQRGASVLSLMMMLMTLAPVAAPTVGSLLLKLDGWTIIFDAMALAGIVCLLATWFAVPESLPIENRIPLHPGTILRNYLRLCLQASYMRPALAGSFAQACMFAFITGSPMVFMGHFRLSATTYGWVFGGIAAGILITAQLTTLMLRRGTRLETLMNVSLITITVSAAVLTATASANLSLAWIIAPLWGVIASLGVLGACSVALAMAASGALAGSASALVGTLQFVFAFAASAIVATLQSGTAVAMSCTMLVLSLLACGVWWGMPRGQTDAPQ